jgi:hypothetical protein
MAPSKGRRPYRYAGSGTLVPDALFGRWLGLVAQVSRTPAVDRVADNAVTDARGY